MKTRHSRMPVERLVAFGCIAIASVAFVLPESAEAQRRGGGAGMNRGDMARSSVSGANRATQQAAMRGNSVSMDRASVSTRPATGSVNTGNRASTGNANTGNRVNTGDVSTGNRVNTGNINTGDINIDRNVNVDVDHDGWGGWQDVDIDVDGGPGDWNIDVDVDHYHPIATATAVAMTAGVVGSYYYAVPTGCPVVYTYPHPYYYCNNVYYQKQMQGDTVVYVVVQP